MESLTFGLVDYLIFTSLLIVSITCGLYFGVISKTKNTTEEYLMGGRKMQVFPVAMSMVASQITSVSIMSVPAEMYAFGFNYIFLVLSIAVVILILNFVIVPIFFENKLDNCYEYLQKRFNKRARQLVTATFILSSLFTLPVFIFVPSLAFSQVTGFNVHLINIIISSICVFYTMLGGIKAVVWTDVLQGGVMLFTVVLVGIMGTIKAGGLAKVMEIASEGGRLDLNFSWDPRVRVTVWNAFTCGVMVWTGYIGFNQCCVQRIVSLPSLRQAQSTLWLAGVGILFIKGLTAFIGIAMYAYYHNCDPIMAGHVEKADKMMPFFVQNIIGHWHGMPGIFISCVFSAALSTLSATFNSLGGIVYFDYIKPFITHTEARANYIMKILIIVMGIYCVAGGLVVQQFSSIIQMMITFFGINMGAVCGIYLLGIFMPRANGKVAVSSFVLSILAMIWIIINGHLRAKQGLIKYESLPTQIDGCDAMHIRVLRKSFFNSSSMSTAATSLSTTNVDFSLYDISFYWYMLLGATLVWLIAIPLSYIWKHDANETQDPKLHSPWVRKFLAAPALELEEVVPLRVKASIT